MQLPKLFYKNPINRCYICKEAMAKSLILIKRRMVQTPWWTVTIRETYMTLCRAGLRWSGMA